MNGTTETRTTLPGMRMLLVLTLFYMLSITMTGPISTGFAASLGASGALMGLASGLTNFISLAVRPMAGRAADMHCRRRLTRWGLLGMLSGNLLCAGASTVFILLLGRCMVGVGFSFVSIALSTWVASCLPPERMGAGMGIYGMVQAVGMAFAPVLGLSLSGSAGYPVAYLAAGALALISFGLTFTAEKPKQVAPPDTQRPREFLCPELLPMVCVVLAMTIPYSAASAFLDTIIRERALPMSAGVFFPIYAALLIVLRGALRRKFDSWSFARFTLLCAPCGVLAMLSFWFLSSYWGLFISALLIAASYGIICPVAQTYGVRSAGEDRRGLANGTYYIGLDAGLALGPLVSGVLYAAVGGRSMFLVLSAVPLFALVARLFAPHGTS